MPSLRIHPALLLLFALLSTAFTSPLKAGNHTDNWAIVVSTSRYWFNYRHTVNALLVYKELRRLGYPDSHIILMLAEDHSLLPRNPLPGQVFLSTQHPSLYQDDTEVDYRGLDVSPESLAALLKGEEVAEDGVPLPRGKRLGSGPGSNVLLYFTGHGGEGFLKFHDRYELRYHTLAAVIDESRRRGRYGRLLVVSDTCKAASGLAVLRSPGVVGISSSDTGQDSYSHTEDVEIGQSTSDGFSYFLTDHLSRIAPPTQPPRPGARVPRGTPSLGQLFDWLARAPIQSTVVQRLDLLGEDVNAVALGDFFWFRGGAGPSR